MLGMMMLDVRLLVYSFGALMLGVMMLDIRLLVRIPGTPMLGMRALMYSLGALVFHVSFLTRFFQVTFDSLHERLQMRDLGEFMVAVRTLESSDALLESS
jgi:hypothetical protein